MSANSIDKEARDNYYVQTVNMDTAAQPTPQMQPYQRTFGNPVSALSQLGYRRIFLT